MAEYKTPGVYIEERDAFPNSVVEVPTGIPAFIGHTERAARGTEALRGVPTRISSWLDYQTMFGGLPDRRVDLGADQALVVAETQYLMALGLRMFFDNGGGPCWVISVGGYDSQPTAEALTAPLAEGGSLDKTPEPALLVIPDAVLLPAGDCARVANAMLDHCGRLGSRFAILDIHGGDRARTHARDDVISGATGFRTLLTSDHRGFGAAYYPWLNTTLIDTSELRLDMIEPGPSRAHLGDALRADAADHGDPRLETLANIVDPRPAQAGAPTPTPLPPMTPEVAHQQAMTASPRYRAKTDRALAALNLLPPAAAMAGVFARVDDLVGVFEAPANTAVGSVASLTVEISDDEQAELNIPRDGKAVNAIRSFLGRGILVWGARTLNGNSQDWRYVSVRRTMIFLEQSIRLATEAYVFAPNTAATWVTVTSMIETFLHNQWKAGALAGATPQDAYDVSVGLGSTMTAQDILDGYMNVTVRVAPTRPAEFIVITFRQKMQAS